MAEQRETTLIVTPFKELLKARGWHVENIHGNQYQMGLPDLYICHPNYSPRWVECKVVEKNGSIKLSDAQTKKFPLFHAYGVPIYVIAAPDLRGERNYELRLKMYKKLFEEPNVHFAFHRRTYSLLY